jgi:hypothetical protein
LDFLFGFGFGLDLGLGLGFSFSFYVGLGFSFGFGSFRLNYSCSCAIGSFIVPVHVASEDVSIFYRLDWILIHFSLNFFSNCLKYENLDMKFSKWIWLSLINFIMFQVDLGASFFLLF